MTEEIEFGCLDCAATFTAKPVVLAGGVTGMTSCPGCRSRNTVRVSADAEAPGGRSSCCGGDECCS